MNKTSSSKYKKKRLFNIFSPWYWLLLVSSISIFTLVPKFFVQSILFKNFIQDELAFVLDRPKLKFEAAEINWNFPLTAQFKSPKLFDPEPILFLDEFVASVKLLVFWFSLRLTVKDSDLAEPAWLEYSSSYFRERVATKNFTYRGDWKARVMKLPLSKISSVMKKLGSTQTEFLKDWKGFISIALNFKRKSPYNLASMKGSFSLAVQNLTFPLPRIPLAGLLPEFVSFEPIQAKLNMEQEVLSLENPIVLASNMGSLHITGQIKWKPSEIRSDEKNLFLAITVENPSSDSRLFQLTKISLSCPDSDNRKINLTGFLGKINCSI